MDLDSGRLCSPVCVFCCLRCDPAHLLHEQGRLGVRAVHHDGPRHAEHRRGADFTATLVPHLVAVPTDRPLVCNTYNAEPLPEYSRQSGGHPSSPNTERGS